MRIAVLDSALSKCLRIMVSVMHYAITEYYTAMF